MYISPLSKIPGPLFSSFTEILVSLKRPEGRVFEWFYSLHLKYGHVVRVGPKFILFDDLEAIKFILKDSENSKATKQRIDILQILLNNYNPLKQSSPTTPVDVTDGKTMSDFEIQDQIMEFLIGGTDTSAFTIIMAIIMLLHHPEKLRNLRLELESAFPELQNHVSSGEHECEHEDDLFLPTHDTLKSLKYLNAVIDETLRLFPVTLGGIMRQTTEDTIISNHLIPKDTIVSASIWKLHRSKQIWDQDVDEFVPERWFDLNPKIRNDAYYPFGSGSRLCIGNNFALMEIRIIISALIGNFDFVPKEGADLQIVQFITPSLRSKKFEVEVTRLREKFSFEQD
ncbi:3165_t:CDS:2 [Gigaspora margarita]|uniref:3165_t:CDS:1 n=1 Tax=Gigaspora margarita TaxID=4874 RepID=A0ABN7V2M3_GIGMA|nr:3165_t:CDS:2 [Gigaspora margarita]